MARKGTGPQRGRLADMSLEPAERGRPRRETPRRRRRVPAQAGHGSNPAACRKRRDGERAMERERLAADVPDAGRERADAS
jgi:hypothetical protein